MATFTGTSSDDILPNLLLGAVVGIGDDTVSGLGGNDTLVGWTGNDVLIGGTGADTLIGGIINIVGTIGTLAVTGIDTASYTGSSAGVDVDLDEAGSFAIVLGGITIGLTGTTTGHGGDAEGDRISGVMNLTGSDHEDALGGNNLVNILNGGRGDDYLQGREGGDTLNGASGIDTAVYVDSAAGVMVDLAAGTASLGDAAGDTLISIENLIGSDFADVFAGSNFANRLDGRDGDDTMSGGNGADVLLGGAGVDTLLGGNGDDALKGGAGDDTITGEAGRDRVVGEDGNDTLLGGAGSDYLLGGNGEDLLNAGIGYNHSEGGAGADIFQFTTLGSGATAIMDWEAGIDKISIDRFAFGTTAPTLTVVNGTSGDAITGDAVFYQTSTGRLFFHDGESDSLVFFASLETNPATVSASDFILT